MRVLVFVVLSCLMLSCGSVPKESVDLMEVVIVQSQKAHALNTALVNKLYSAKKKEVDVFIDGQYTDAFWENFQDGIPDGVDLEANMNAIIPSISKEINAQRNKMKAVLEEARLQTIELINENYSVQQEAASALKELLVSATKVDEDRKAILQRYAKQFNTGLDINELELYIDQYINKAGDAGADIDELGLQLIEQLNKL